MVVAFCSSFFWISEYFEERMSMLVIGPSEYVRSSVLKRLSILKVNILCVWKLENFIRVYNTPNENRPLFYCHAVSPLRT